MNSVQATLSLPETGGAVRGTVESEVGKGNRMAKYIEFDEVMPAPRGVWVIRSKSQDAIIGRIEWYARWRQYVAIFTEDSVWSEGCLADVREFMLSLSNARGQIPPASGGNLDRLVGDSGGDA
jgi:hypothetical protein